MLRGARTFLVKIKVHDVLVKSLEKVAGEGVGENGGWKIKLIVFVGGTCGSVHTQTFNNNLKERGVIESKRNTLPVCLLIHLLLLYLLQDLMTVNGNHHLTHAREKVEPHLLSFKFTTTSTTNMTRR